MNLISIIAIIVVAMILTAILELCIFIIRRNQYKFMGARFGIEVFICIVLVVLFFYWKLLFK